MRQFFVSLIPRFVNNSLVILFFEILRRSQLRHRRLSGRNLVQNRTAYHRHRDRIRSRNGYVEDQNAYADMRYGKSALNYNGCEILAVYNALYTLTGHHPISLHRLIEAYEKDGMVLTGRFGTSPVAARDFFVNRGYETVFSTKESEFDAIGAAYDSMILTMYNDRTNILKEIHTIHISKNKDQLTAHNVYCNGQTVGPYPSVTELIHAIHGGRAKGISLIGIRRKNE